MNVLEVLLRTLICFISLLTIGLVLMQSGRGNNLFGDLSGKNTRGIAQNWDFLGRMTFYCLIIFVFGSFGIAYLNNYKNKLDVHLPKVPSQKHDAHVVSTDKNIHLPKVPSQKKKHDARVKDESQQKQSVKKPVRSKKENIDNNVFQ